MQPSYPQPYPPQPQQPYAPQGFVAPPPAAAPSATGPLVISMASAFSALAMGVVTFLIAGFEGHSAGWELLAIPTLIAMTAALVAGVAAIVAITRKSIGGGVLAIGVSGFGVLLALLGFVLGA
jgi:hypothetical protein